MHPTHQPVEEVHLGPILCEKPSLLHGTVSPPDHSDGLIAENRGGAIANSACTDALVPAAAAPSKRIRVLSWEHAPGPTAGILLQLSTVSA